MKASERCRACGKLDGEHDLLLSAEDIGTPADCAWMIRVLEAEDWLRESGSVFSLLGMSNNVSGDITRQIALLIVDRDDDIWNEALKQGCETGWKECKDAYGIQDPIAR